MLKKVILLLLSVVPILQAVHPLPQEVLDQQLLYAIQARQPHMIRQRLSQGADVNARDEKGNSPLMYAAQACNTALVKLLLDAGAEVNAENNEGETALFMALKASSYEQKWKQSKSYRIYNSPRYHDDRKIDEFWDIFKSEVEQLAQKEIDIIQLLLNAGADVHHQNAKEYSPLLFFLDHNGDAPKATPLARLLLEAGAHPNEFSKQARDIPLFSAIDESHRPMVALLIAFGADVNLCSNMGCPIEIALDEQYDGKIAKMLHAAGAEFPDDEEEERMLDWLLGVYASEDTVHVDMLEALIAYGADINARINGSSSRDMKKDKTALLLAARTGHIEHVRLLLQAGADIYVTDAHGNSPLKIARTNCRYDVASLLKKWGAKEFIPILKEALMPFIASVSVVGTAVGSLLTYCLLAKS